MLKVLILKKRKDFVRVAQGLKVAAPGLILQAAQSLSSPHREIPEDGCFLGYTVTKKVSKAHIRNRSKRRLRAAAREVFPDNARVKTDYVLIGRYNTADIEFKKLVSEMKKALCKINKMMSEPQDKTDAKKADDIAD